MKTTNESLSSTTISNPEIGKVSSSLGSTTIQWYRTKLDKATHQELHARSDAKGFFQSAGYLAIVLTTGALAGVLAYRGMWIGFLLTLFLHGTVSAFMINAVHELTHGTVFKTKFWNLFFARIFACIGWINHEIFTESHARHHRYTLHDPDDMEVVLPLKVIVRDFFTTGFIHPMGMLHTICDLVRVAHGRFNGNWENKLFPENSPDRSIPIRWSRIVLTFHASILFISLLTGWWWIFVITSLTPLYGLWLFFLMNNTQHIGLQDHVSDFRLCCRTFTVNPLFQFLYWHMNYHTEHHMYAAVPCYNLKKLHTAVSHDLPPSCHGLLQTWIEIAYIQRMQKEIPDYQHAYILPNASNPSSLN